MMAARDARESRISQQWLERLNSTRLRGKLRLNEPMARHTSWRVGGLADVYYQPADSNDFAELLSQWPPEAPLLCLGLGSNLLVRDGGIRGLVAAISGMLKGLERLEDNRVRVEAGVACAKLARFCGREGLLGAEFLAGIPGTLGGALAMNAGAFGGEIWSLVDAVETLDRRGLLHLRKVDEYAISYRHVQGPENEWFVSAFLRLPEGDVLNSQSRIKKLLAQRSATQPTGQPSGGSVFRNPEGDFAGRLIEASGLKGYCIGGACVSEKHANFFISNGAATAVDLEALIDYVQGKVQDRQGIQLRTEIHIVGELLASNVIHKQSRDRAKNNDG